MVTLKRFMFIVVIGLPLSGSLGCSKRSEVQPTDEKSSAVRFNGYLDGASEGHITGWAMDEKNVDEAVTVSIYDGSTLLGGIKADVFRKDLLDNKIATGKYGFAFPVPPSLFDGKRHRIHAKIQGTDVELKLSPKELTFNKAKSS